MRHTAPAKTSACLEPGGGVRAHPAALQRCLRRILDRLPDGVFEWDYRTGEAFYSAAVPDLLGAGPGTLAADFAAFLAHVAAADQPCVLQALRHHLGQRTPLVVEFRAAAGEGQRWLRLHGEADCDATGRPLRTVGTLIDVTVQRRSVDQLRESEGVLRRALDGLHAALAVLDSRGRIVEINHAWRECDSSMVLCGLRFGFGEDYAELLRHVADRAGGAGSVAAGVAAVVAGTEQEYKHDYSVEAAGDLRYLQLQVRGLGEGEERIIVVIHIDTSGVASASRSATRLQDFYELILDSLPLQIAYVRRSGEFVYANAAYERWFGLPSAAIEGHSLPDIVSPENLIEVAPRIETVLAGHDVEFECRVAHNGEDRDLAVRYRPHLDQDGEAQGFFSVVRDVTAERQLEAGLRQAQKMEAIGRLTGGIAHDFNNLLNVIIGNLQLLERTLGHDARLGRNVETALRSALRGADLTRRLLAFSRQQRLEPRVVAVDAVLEGLAELVMRSLGRGIEVRTDLASGGAVRVDPGQLEDAVLNLAINARDAMPEGGTLTLTSRSLWLGQANPDAAGLVPGEYVLVEVHDTGQGMPADVARRAFEPFFTTKQVGKGTGLGLAIVYGFIKQSGGGTVIDSAPGRGTRVRLYLPRVATAAASGVEQQAAPSALPTGQEFILLVDGDADARATTHATLSGLGYQVVEADCGATALQVLDGLPQVRLMFSDVALPGRLSGTELVRLARQRRPGLRVLLASGFTDTAVLDRALAEGVVDVLAKPYSIDELAGQVRALLDGDAEE